MNLKKIINRCERNQSKKARTYINAIGRELMIEKVVDGAYATNLGDQFCGFLVKKGDGSIILELTRGKHDTKVIEGLVVPLHVERAFYDGNLETNPV